MEGVPHRLCQDDWYEVSGQRVFLPKNTICVVNAWLVPLSVVITQTKSSLRGLNHDPDVYGADAEEFKPERHLDEAGSLKPATPETKDESHVSYGFGRR